MDKLPTNKISFEEYKHLLDVLKNKRKTDFGGYNTIILKRRIEAFYSDFSFFSFEKFTEQIISQDKIFKKFIKKIIVPTTEFFRDPTMWNILEKEILPELLKNKKKIKIWIPEISSGEELVSLLILLKRIKAHKNSEITATSPYSEILSDFSENLQFSNKKLETSLQNFTDFDKNINPEAFFQRNEDYYFYQKENLQEITFEKFCFAQDNPSTSYDLILFRNRMLYFNLKYQNFVLDKISTALEPQGILILGIKENIKHWPGFHELKAKEKNESIYQKK